ncbi:hypothetical protein ACZ87_00193 [Candidatus Erwinia dacicola]|uniref:Ead/Ea22-like family protein n=1 Tax=Candidatus Erwinia dacicola TaxID=252393 RepID=A0A328TW26_9GAMM|nr:hypothetical protein ACZ87_00193 [Candidatus Erwinia dacicola]
MTEIKRYEDDIASLQEQLSSYSMSAGQADQRKAESDAVRVALGFSADSDDVAPCDLVDAIAALQEQVRAAESNKWKPEFCPVTKRPFFMWIERPGGGMVPTYGGPYDSYTIPVVDSDGEFSCERYDHDEGAWVDDVCLSHRLIDDQMHVLDDAALREIRAQAVEGFAEHIAFYHSDSKSHALDYAARIRAGE